MHTFSRCSEWNCRPLSETSNTLTLMWIYWILVTCQLKGTQGRKKCLKWIEADDWNAGTEEIQSKIFGWKPFFVFPKIIWQCSEIGAKFKITITEKGAPNIFKIFKIRVIPTSSSSPFVIISQHSLPSFINLHQVSRGCSQIMSPFFFDFATHSSRLTHTV